VKGDNSAENNLNKNKWLNPVSVQSTVFNNTFQNGNRKLICHKFVLDAEKDNGVLMFDKERLVEKLTEIISMVLTKKQELNA